jgi:hypothetical protein
MKSNNVQLLQNVYLHDQTFYKTFTLEQELQAVDYLKESNAVLKDLCGSIALKVYHILVTCCDLVEMSRSIPSTAQQGATVNMENYGCLSVNRLAALIKRFNNDPLSVTPAMIRKDCDLIVAYHS